jgi:hypothetical protein
LDRQSSTTSVLKSSALKQRSPARSRWAVK